MASDQSTERIPLGRGVYIKFSRDGRALHGGCNEEEIVPLVEAWIRGSRGEERGRLEKWLEQKAAQVEQDQRVQQARAKRAMVDAEVRKHIRKIDHLRDHEELIRREAYKQCGLPEEDD